MKNLLFIFLFSLLGSFPETTDYVGTLTVRPNTSREFTLENVRVTLIPNADNTRATLVLHHVRFSRMMFVGLNVTVPDITTIFSNGKLALAGNGIVPIHGTTEHPEKVIYNLGGSAVECQLSFKMKMGGVPIVYKGRIH